MKCSRCGECCKSLSEIVIYEEDIGRWKEEGRIDILKHFLLSKTKKPNEYLADFVEDNGNETCSCPFLKEKRNIAECSIYNTRPVICRENPEIDVDICNKNAYINATLIPILG
ncbi:MAG: YkgJ family cysteine cluster protein [Candidatus Aenigmatarchaeota archaeon]